MIHFFIVLCIWDLPERHNIAHVFLLQKIIFFCLYIFYIVTETVFSRVGFFFFVITFVFFVFFFCFFFFALVGFHSAQRHLNTGPYTQSIN